MSEEAPVTFHEIVLPLRRPTLIDARRLMVPVPLRTPADEQAAAEEKLLELMKAAPAHGESRRMEWPGGSAGVTADGVFLKAEGVSTAVAVHLAQRLPDGRLDRGVLITSIRESGSRVLNLPPGELWLHGSGPNGWRVQVDIVELKPASKTHTLEQRVAALTERTQHLENVSATRN